VTEKWRQVAERPRRAKLTPDDVRAIRRRWADRAQTGEDQTAIAADYGVDNTQVSRIVNRITWRHVA
jgi:DNA invertase Pin-like site-specific DNA recombinase